MTMQVILQGSLRHFRPAELLRFLGAGGHEGTLDLQSADGARARLFFRAGALIWGEAADAIDLAGVVTNALSCDGSFALLDDVVLPEGVTEHAGDLNALIAEAEKRIAAAKSFPDDTRFSVNADKAQVTMSGDEFKLVLRLGTPKSFGELVAETGRTRDELADLLRAMLEKGLVERQAPPPVVKPAVPEQTQIVPKRRMAALTRDNGDVETLIEDLYTIGRDPATNNIVLADSSISTHHARIVRNTDSFTIEDLGSRNGTFVNGEKIAAPQPLADNDVIRVGRVILTFNLAREVRPTSTTQRKLK